MVEGMRPKNPLFETVPTYTITEERTDDHGEPYLVEVTYQNTGIDARDANSTGDKNHIISTEPLNTSDGARIVEIRKGMGFKPQIIRSVLPPLQEQRVCYPPAHLAQELPVKEKKTTPVLVKNTLVSNVIQTNC